MNSRLTHETINKAITILAQRDPDLDAVIKKHGKPLILRRPGSIKTLVLLILEQQVSLASARAAYNRLSVAVGEFTPEKFLLLSDGEFRTAGVSRQKTNYIRDLSERLIDGTFELCRLPRMNDDAAREHLKQVKGIGSWTADVYLLIGLMRPNIWPAGDVALQAAVHSIKGLEARPSPELLTKIGEQWRPWRSVAARILWHYYLSTPRYK